jgi:arsenic resistance protein ArsH
VWSGLNADGSVNDIARSDPERRMDELGRPVHITCCPTGTIDFATGGCCNQDSDPVEATVKALSTNISTHPPRFLILSGSLRKESYSRKCAIEVGRILAAYGAEVKLFDPEGLPLYNNDQPASHPKVQELRQLTRWCEGMVWISPEIHGNYSAVFKNQIDWMPLSEGAIRPTQGKTVAVMQVEAGSQSFNTVNNLRTLGRWMRCVVIPNQSSIPQAYKEFKEDGTFKDSSLRDRVVDVTDELFKYTLLLRDQQPYLVNRYSEKKASAKKHLEQTKLSSSPETLRALESPIIVDVRSELEVETQKGGAPVVGSVNVPLNVDGVPQSEHQTTAEEFKQKLEKAGVKLPADKKAAFITHCTADATTYYGRGARAAALLRDMGYENAHNGGSTDKIRSSRG